MFPLSKILAGTVCSVQGRRDSQVPRLFWLSQDAGAPPAGGPGPLRSVFTQDRGQAEVEQAWPAGEAARPPPAVLLPTQLSEECRFLPCIRK